MTRDIQGLETENSNGLYSKQRMLTDETVELFFDREVDITRYFKTVAGRFVSPGSRCLVQIGLRYSWDSDICPDFKIVVQSGNVTIASKQGLDDYPDVTNTGEMTIVLIDATNFNVKLTKTDSDYTKFKLYTNSFIKIDVI